MRTATFVANGQGKVDGVIFPHGVPVEVDDDTYRRLKDDPNYEVEIIKKEEAEKVGVLQDYEQEVNDGDGSV